MHRNIVTSPRINTYMMASTRKLFGLCKAHVHGHGQAKRRYLFHSCVWGWMGVSFKSLMVVVNVLRYHEFHPFHPQYCWAPLLQLLLPLLLLFTWRRLRLWHHCCGLFLLLVCTAIHEHAMRHNEAPLS